MTSISYRVPYADTDQMGVVYYANYLVWFERCRNEMLRDAGLPYTRLEAEGVMLPVVEAHCDYRIPARYDDLLSITAAVEKIGSPGKFVGKALTIYSIGQSRTQDMRTADDRSEPALRTIAWPALPLAC